MLETKNHVFAQVEFEKIDLTFAVIQLLLFFSAVLLFIDIFLAD